MRTADGTEGFTAEDAGVRGGFGPLCVPLRGLCASAVNSPSQTGKLFFYMPLAFGIQTMSLNRQNSTPAGVLTHQRRRGQILRLDQKESARCSRYAAVLEDCSSAVSSIGSTSSWLTLPRPNVKRAGCSSMILSCSLISPYSSASGLGGHPGM